MSFVEFSDPSSPLTLDDWAMETTASLARLNELVSQSEDNAAITGVDPFPSLVDMVEKEIAIGSTRSLEAIAAERLELLAHWDTQALKSHWETQDLTSLKFQLPNQMISFQPTEERLAKEATVEIQIFKTLNCRQTLVFQINLGLETTLQKLFDQISKMLPAGKMFDGPLYPGGLLVTPETLYIPGNDYSYAEPYLTWLGQMGLPLRPVVPMDSVRLGSLPMSVVTACPPVYMECFGDEKLVLVFSNMSTAKESVLKRRKFHKLVRCGLCTSRAADLVVLNDELLPKNPTHACTQCYRRLRSDINGAFVDPPETVIVSAFSQI